jgi:prepilin-type N-terminal cleavage/methylation domain-containing protein
MKMIDIKYKKAFTMLEVIFVIVILGIVSSIGAEIIADVYKSYIIQRASHRSSVKTELAATQIANRLTYAISGTVIGRKSSNKSFRSVTNLDSNEYDVLEWVEYDNDSFSAKVTPGWSGFVDISSTDTNTTHLDTKGSELNTTDDIIKNLSDNNSNLSDAALFFESEYTAQTIGYENGISANNAIDITGRSGTSVLNVSNLTGKTITEHYKLAWSAYALVPSDNGDGTFNLDLYYDYQPWKGETYEDDAKHQTLVRNVTVFKFIGTENGIRFKLCQSERISDENNITICKEKAVIR